MKAPEKKGKSSEGRSDHVFMWILIVFLVGMLITTAANAEVQEVKELTYNEFLVKLEQQEVKKVQGDLEQGSNLVITLSDEKSYQVPNPKLETFKELLLKADVEVVEVKSGSLLRGLSSVLSLLLTGGIFYFLLKTVQAPQKKKSPITDQPTTRLTDVAGLEEVKEEIDLLIQFLKQPERFHAKGAKLPKGVVLYGHPGTGKTLLARAIAGEAGVPFFNISGSEFIEMYAGVGARRVRELFKEARQVAPCIIFIDEIDAVGGKRQEQLGNGENRQTLNALLSEMDGFQPTEGVLVICATNRLGDLDPALIRPGRFDKQIQVPLPQTTQERLDIINLYRKGRHFDESIEFETLAKETIGFSPADLEVLMNEATLISIQTGKEQIDQACLDEAFYKKILKGHAKKNADRTPEEIQLVAWHEAGHAIMAHAMEVEVSKVTIIPSTSGAGGVNFMVPKRLGMYSLEELEGQVKISYAGRCAEYLLLGDKNKITTGAEADIQQATQIIYQMVAEQGMSDECGMINLSMLQVKPEAYLPKITAWSQRLEEETLRYLESNKDQLERVATTLIEKETLSKSELLELLNQERKEKTSL